MSEDLVAAAPNSAALRPYARAASVPVRMADLAYEQLRDALINLRIEPGAPLDEKQLSASMGVGLTPVRDALKRLTLERLVDIYPRRGTFASDIRLEDEVWLTETRAVLEGLAASLAAQRATPAECEALISIADKLDGGPDILELTNIDIELHREIYAAAHNPYLEATASLYANLAMRVWNYGLRKAGGSELGAGCSLTATVKAIAARDPEGARISALEHLRDYDTALRSLLYR